MLFLYFILISFTLLYGGYKIMPLLPRAFDQNLVEKQSPYCINHIINGRIGNIYSAILSLEQKGLVEINLNETMAMIKKVEKGKKEVLLEYENAVLAELEPNKRTNFQTIYDDFSSFNDHPIQLLYKHYDKIGVDSGVRYDKTDNHAKTYNFLIAFLLLLFGSSFTYSLYSDGNGDFIFMIILTALAIIISLNIEHKTTYSLTRKGELFSKNLKNQLRQKNKITELSSNEDTLSLCVLGSVALDGSLKDSYFRLSEIIKKRRDLKRKIYEKSESNETFDSCSCDSCSCS